MRKTDQNGKYVELQEDHAEENLLAPGSSDQNVQKGSQPSN